MKDKTIERLIYAIFALVLSSCMTSFSYTDLYQDGAWVNAQWLGQDVVSLFIAIPVLMVAYFKSIRREKWKWNLVLAGALFYFVYTYAFYTIVAKLNFLYFFHLGIFSCSIFLLFTVLHRLLKSEYRFEGGKGWIKWSAILFFLLNSIMLTFLWTSEIVSHYTIPGYRSSTPDGEPTMIIYTLDLAIVVPLMLIAAYGYWRNRRYGYILTGVMLTKTALVGFALMGMSLSMYLQETSPDIFLVYLWCFIGVVGTLLTGIYLQGVYVAKQKTTNLEKSGH